MNSSRQTSGVLIVIAAPTYPILRHSYAMLGLSPGALIAARIFVPVPLLSIFASHKLPALAGTLTRNRKMHIPR